MSDPIVAWLPLIGGIIVAIVGGVIAVWNRWGADRFSRRQPLPPTWPDMWRRIDLQDRKIAALGRMLAATADQWPKEVPGPVFDPEDIEILEDTFPAARWLKRPA